VPDEAPEPGDAVLPAILGRCAEGNAALAVRVFGRPIHLPSPSLESALGEQPSYRSWPDRPLWNHLRRVEDIDGPSDVP
jgi:hypothetical protein